MVAPSAFQRKIFLSFHVCAPSELREELRRRRDCSSCRTDIQSWLSPSLHGEVLPAPDSANQRCVLKSHGLRVAAVIVRQAAGSRAEPSTARSGASTQNAAPGSSESRPSEVAGRIRCGARLPLSRSSCWNPGRRRCSRAFAAQVRLWARRKYPFLRKAVQVFAGEVRQEPQVGSCPQLRSITAQILVQEDVVDRGSASRLPSAPGC